jgi:hypothetical protein
MIQHIIIRPEIEKLPGYFDHLGSERRSTARKGFRTAEERPDSDDCKEHGHEGSRNGLVLLPILVQVLNALLKRGPVQDGRHCMGRRVVSVK